METKQPKPARIRRTLMNKDPAYKQRAYNAYVETALGKQDRLQELLNDGECGRWVGFKQDEEQETAIELSLLTRKNGKVPAVFYD